MPVPPQCEAVVSWGRCTCPKDHAGPHDNGRCKWPNAEELKAYFERKVLP